MIVIQLQNFWANEPNEIDITDMGAVMIKDGKLYFNDSGVAWGGDLWIILFLKNNGSGSYH